MLEAFLIVAMALPACHFSDPISDDDRIKIEEIKKIREFIRERHPDADIVIPPSQIPDEALKEMGLERIPFLYRGQRIFIRRKPISDRRTGMAA